VRAGIQPDAHIKYSSHDIVAAVEQHIGAQPLVHCSRGSLTEVSHMVNAAVAAEEVDYRGCSTGQTRCSFPDTSGPDMDVRQRAAGV